MTKTTPHSIIGAAVIDIESDGDCIYHIVLEHPDGRIVELVANRDIEVDGVPWMEVM